MATPPWRTASIPGGARAASWSTETYQPASWGARRPRPGRRPRLAQAPAAPRPRSPATMWSAVQPLARPPRSRARPAATRARARGGIHLEVVGPSWNRSGWVHRPGARPVDLIEGPVVAKGHQLRAQQGIEGAIGRLPRPPARPPAGRPSPAPRPPSTRRHGSAARPRTAPGSGSTGPPGARSPHGPTGGPHPRRRARGRARPSPWHGRHTRPGRAPRPRLPLGALGGGVRRWRLRGRRRCRRRRLGDQLRSAGRGDVTAHDHHRPAGGWGRGRGVDGRGIRRWSRLSGHHRHHLEGRGQRRAADDKTGRGGGMPLPAARTPTDDGGRGRVGRWLRQSSKSESSCLVVVVLVVVPVVLGVVAVIVVRRHLLSRRSSTGSKPGPGPSWSTGRGLARRRPCRPRRPTVRWRCRPRSGG